MTQTLHLPPETVARLESEPKVYIYFEAPDTSMIGRCRCDEAIFGTHRIDIPYTTGIRRYPPWAGVSIRHGAGDVIQAWRDIGPITCGPGDTLEATITPTIA